MNYISDLADEIRSEVPTELLPDGDASLLLLIYAVLFLAEGQAAEPANVHNAWAVWMTYRGKDHESLVPFDELPPGRRRRTAPL